MAWRNFITFSVLAVVAFTLVFVSIFFQLKKTSSPPSSFHFNATVSLKGGGSYRTISDAVAAAPTFSQVRYFIRVEAGTYHENVVIMKNKTNIALIGDGADMTIITADRHAPTFKTLESATVYVEGDGFMAQHITFENSAGSESGQAVALMSVSNHSVFYKCVFLGYQDTLYAREGFQFYRECDIHGTSDFIFGDAAAVFQTCNLYARLPNRMITFTAQGRKGLETQSGYTIHNCSITVSPGLESNQSGIKGYLGRPWFDYSTVMVMESYLDTIIDPSGWIEWPGNSLNKLTYQEYKNSGPGSDTSRRITWPTYKVLNQPTEAIPFTVSKFIDGDAWIPATGVPYTGGFIEPSPT